MLASIDTYKGSVAEDSKFASFEGEITEAKINELLGAVEKHLEEKEEDFKKQRKVYNILVEMLQNLFHHTDKYQDISINEQGEPVKSVAFYIALNEDGYHISSANYIALDNVEALKTKLDKINGLDKDGLRSYYKEVLNNGEYSVHGGGGLGMIDIARKSGNKLEYYFSRVDEQFGAFVFKVKV